MQALAAYGGDESDSDGDNSADLEDMTLHLKPKTSYNPETSISKTICVASAPETVTKVGTLLSDDRQPGLPSVGHVL